MRITTKLWTIGVAAGLAAFGALSFAAGYVVAEGSRPGPGFLLATAVFLCLACLSICSCLSAVIVRTLKEDQRAGAVLREMERHLSDDYGSATVLPFKRGG